MHADLATLADRFQRTEAEIEAALDTARMKLFAAREKRVHPGRDEKILTSWNGMMIRAMAHAGRLLGRQDFVDSAERAFDFVRAQLWRDGRLLATTKDGKAHLNAYLDDYVHLMDGGLALLQARFHAADLDFIRDLADTVLAHFEDKTRGGFYFTSDDHESLLHRPKPAGDDAIPSGNGIAAQVLLRLGHLLGETRYLDAAERTLTALGGAVAQYPSAHCGLLLALGEYLNPPQTIVLRGTPDALRSWHARCGTRYAPGRTALAIPADVTNLTGLLAERRVQGNITAYLCSGHACQAPVSTFEEFRTRPCKPAKSPDCPWTNSAVQWSASLRIKRTRGALRFMPIREKPAVPVESGGGNGSLLTGMRDLRRREQGRLYAELPAGAGAVCLAHETAQWRPLEQGRPHRAARAVAWAVPPRSLCRLSCRPGNVAGAAAARVVARPAHATARTGKTAPEALNRKQDMNRWVAI